MVLDGSEMTDESIRSMLTWDVYNGVARRSWSGNRNAQEAITAAMNDVSGLKVTIPYDVQDESIWNDIL
jgi:urocanate hydratase